MTRTFRQAALFALLGICLAGFALPSDGVGAGVGGTGAKKENSEPPHELLYKIINFVILVGGLGYLLRKPLAEFFSSRSASIQKSLDEGRKALEASQAQLKVVEEKLRGLEAEIAAFKASALREMEAERQRMKQAERGGSGPHSGIRARPNRRRRARSQAGTEKLRSQKSVTLAEELIRARLDDSGRKRLVTQFVATIETKERKNFRLCRPLLPIATRAPLRMLLPPRGITARC